MAKMYILMALTLLGVALISCRSVDLDGIPDAEERYLVDDDFEKTSEKRLSIKNPLESEHELRFVDGTLYDLSEYLRKNSVYSLVTNVNDVKLSGLYCGGVSKIVHDIALANNLNYGRVGDTFYLINGDSSSLDVTVSINCRVSVDVVSKLFDGPIVSDNGRIIYRGSLDKALQLQDIIDALNNGVNDNYCVSVVQVETSKELAYNLQVDLVSKGVDLLTPGVSGWDVFSASARAAGYELEFDNYHERQFYISDGQKITYNHTFDKKLEQRSISDAGTSTVSGYVDVQAGSIINLTVARSLGNNVLVSYDLELSSFDSETIDKHVVKVTSSDVEMALGKIYYLASSQDKNISKSMRLLGLGKDDNNLVTTIFVKIQKIRPR